MNIDIRNLPENGGQHYYTSNFYVSAFLLTKGLELADVDRANPKRVQFVFRDTPEREPLLDSFNFAPEDSPEVLVDARKFVAAVKKLKNILYQGES